MHRILEGFEKKYSTSVHVEEANLMERSDLVQKYNVRVVPTLIFLNPKGEELFRHEGIMVEDQLLEKWNELGFPLQEAQSN